MRVLLLLGIVTSLTGAARADRDPYDVLRRADGTLPARYDNLDRMHAVPMGVETWVTLGGRQPRTDYRAYGGDFVLPLSRDYRDHDHLLSLAIMTLDYQQLGLRASDLTLQGLGSAVRLDHPQWGVSLGAYVLSLSGGERVIRFLTPALGLRLGPSSGTTASLEARFPHAPLFQTSDRPRTLRSNYELALTATTPLGPIWHAQLRARMRNRSDADRVLTESFVAVGLEAAFDIHLRFLPAFIGVGVRHVAQHLERRQDPERGSVLAAAEPPGLQLLFVVALDMGIHGDNSIW